MKKRILAAVLSLVMVVSLLPMSALAAGIAGPSQVSTEADSPVQITKQAAQNEDGTYTIQMDSYVSGNIQITNPTPLDIVLVLDVSGSMEDEIPSADGRYDETAKIDVLKSAVNGMIDATAEQNQSIADPSQQNRISIVKFAGKSTSKVGNQMYKESGNFYNYSQIVQDLTPVSGENISVLKKNINKLEAAGATSADYGLQHAKTVLSQSTDHDKVVVFFTDGEPNHHSGFDTQVAAQAVNTAKALKEDGAMVYTIGVVKGADPSDTSTDINKYMNAVSSNYPKAEAPQSQSGRRFSVNLGEGGNQGYYKAATNAAELHTIFGEISSNIIPSVTAGPESVLQDTLDGHFQFTGADPVVTVYQASGTGAAPTWTKTALPQEIRTEIQDKTVGVTGFDYAANSVHKDQNGVWTGKKLVVSFLVQPDRAAAWDYGANVVKTNIAAAEDTQNAGLYYDGEKTTLKDAPEVTVNTYQVTYQWSGKAPEEAVLPQDNTVYFKGDTCTVQDVPAPIQTKDAYGNVNGEWTLTGWDREGTFPVEQDVTITGTWVHTPVSVAQHTVSYQWTGLPEGAEVPLPAAKEYVLGQPVTLDTSYAKGASAQVGEDTYVFSGWTSVKPELAEGNRMPNADVVVSGTWMLDNWKDGNTIEPEGEDGLTGGDGIPDAYQTVVKFAAKDNGTVSGPTVQVFTKNSDGKITVTPENVIPKAAENYAFDIWTKDKAADAVNPFVEQALALGSTTVYYANFAADTKGGGDNGTDPDGIPDKYQAVVTYKVENGTWDGKDASAKVHVFTMKAKDAKTGTWQAADPAPVLGKTIPEGMKANTGYTGGAWNTEISQETLVPAGGATYTYSFDLIGLHIKYEANAPKDTTPDGSMAATPVNYGQDVTLTANAYTVPDYVFTGWNTEANGTGKSYTDQAEISGVTENLTLYAQWEKDVWNDKEDKIDEGDGIPDAYQAVVKFAAKDNGTVSGPTVQVFTKNSDGKIVVTPEDVTPEAAEDYVFDIWTKGKAADAVDPFVEQALALGSTTVYYANFVDQTYRLTYDANGGTGDIQDTNAYKKGTEVTLSKDRFSHDDQDGVKVVQIGWTAEKDSKIYTQADTKPATLTEVTFGAADQTVYAVYGLDTNGNGIPDVVEARYTVTYHWKDAASEDQTQVTGDLLTGTAIPAGPEAYTPDGHTGAWVLTEGTEGENKTVGKTDLVYTWTTSARADLSYSVVYYYNGVQDDSQTVVVGDQTFGTIVKQYPDKSRDGYTLDRVENLPLTVGLGDNLIKVYYSSDNWKDTDPEDPNKPDSETGGDKIPDSQQVLVKFAVAGEGGTLAEGALNPQVFTLTKNDAGYTGTIQPVQVEAVPAAGFALTGWTLNDGQDAVDPFAERTVSGGEVYTFYAHFAINQYTLTYESNGGTAYDPEVYSAGQTVTLDKVPMREGYTFTGWYASEATETPIGTVTMNQDQTVYAGWIKTEIPPDLDGADHIAYVIGYPDGTVRPEGKISRAEVATIFFRLLKDDIRDGNLTKENVFKDVNDGQWFLTSISTMAKLGIVNGRTPDTFAPNKPITRAEFATICARFDTSETQGNSSFTDLEGHWAKEEVQRAVSLGWIMGYEDNTFRPDKPITRAEAMTMINRVLNRIPGSAEDLHPDMRVWRDNPSTAWYYLAVQEATNSHTHEMIDESHEHWTGIKEDPDWSRYQD